MHPPMSVSQSTSLNEQKPGPSDVAKLKPTDDSFRLPPVSVTVVCHPLYPMPLSTPPAPSTRTTVSKELIHVPVTEPQARGATSATASLAWPPVSVTHAPALSTNT